MKEMQKVSKYTIKEVASFAGITTEAVRYYEKQGLVISEKNEENGYRYYKTWDIHMLMQARLYRQYGYSMNETKEMLQESTMEELEDLFAQKEQDLHESIVQQMRTLNYLRERRNVIGNAKEQSQQIRLETRPAMYRFDIQNNYSLIDDNDGLADITQRLMNDTPYIVSSACFDKNDFINDEPVFSFGFSILEAFANPQILKNNQAVHYYEESTCVSAVAVSTEKHVLRPHIFQKALDYIYEQGLQITGDVVTNVVAYREKNGVKEVIHKIWIPVF